MRQVPLGICFVLLTTLLLAAVPAPTGAGTFLAPMPPQSDGRFCPPPVPARPPAQARVVKVPPPCARPLPPRPACGGGPVPVAVEDPGPVRPILYHGVSLLGSVVAAPFRLVEMLVDYTKKKTCRPPLAPCAPPPQFAPRAVSKCARPPVCGPPVCPPPLACAPPGPSISPLPGSVRGPTCGPPLPARVIHDPEYPPVEPRGLASGIRYLPSRIRSRGRIAGDLPRRYGPIPCGPYTGR